MAMKPAPVARILSPADLEGVLADPSPVLIFKHSTACPVSAHAHREFQAWLDSDDPKPRTALVRVIEERPLSREIAARLGVTHQSPQAILVADGRAHWHASHSDITHESLRDACAGPAG